MLQYFTPRATSAPILSLRLRALPLSLTLALAGVLTLSLTPTLGQPATLTAQQATGALASPTPQPSAADSSAVVQVLLDLFDGMRAKDEALLRSVWHPEARLLTAPGGRMPDEGALRSTAIDAFVQGVLAGEAHLDEVIFDVQVHIDGRLASAWAPYNLFVDGRFQHCGVDAVQLVHEAEVGRWLITQLTDTRRVYGCAPDRRD